MFLLDILLIFILWLHFKDISVSIILISLGQKYCFSFHPVTGISQKWEYFSLIFEYLTMSTLHLFENFSESNNLRGRLYGDFQSGLKFQPVKLKFYPTQDENLILRTRELLVYFFLKKIKIATSQARFKWTDDKAINFIKCL